MREYDDLLYFEPETIIGGYEELESKEETDGHVKLISYEGSWPTLCSGILTLEIDGKTYVFGPDYKKPKDVEEYYDTFWHSKASCGFWGGDYNRPHTTKSPWVIEIREMPKELVKYSIEISRLLNEKVPWPCCGGCL